MLLGREEQKQEEEIEGLRARVDKLEKGKKKIEGLQTRVDKLEKGRDERKRKASEVSGGTDDLKQRLGKLNKKQ